jgi:DNA-binding transcriptional LysR family regulator
LVRAGRGLVPTPRALELRARVSQLVQDSEAVLRPAEKLNLKQLVRTFTLRTSEGFVENFGPDLIARIGAEAPGVRLRFMQKPDKDSAPLRDGIVDLETGVVGKTTVPELRVQALFRDRFIGVVRMGHSLSQGEITPSRYAAGRHIFVSRRGIDKGSIDEALKPFELERIVFPFRSPRQRSQFHCSGTRGFTPIRRIAGCADAFGISARPPSEGVSLPQSECHSGDIVLIIVGVPIGRLRTLTNIVREATHPTASTYLHRSHRG